jgi:hypothetical protein
MKWMINSMEEASIYRFKDWKMRGFDGCGINKRINRNVTLITMLEV